MLAAQMRRNAEEAATKFNGAPPLSQTEIDQAIEGEKASKSEVLAAADLIMDELDELLQVDSRGQRKKIKDDIIYDVSLDYYRPGLDKETAAMAATASLPSGIAAIVDPSYVLPTLTISAPYAVYNHVVSLNDRADAGYDPISGGIGLSKNKLPKLEAYDVLGAELTHKYQDEFDSDLMSTIGNRVTNLQLTEGFERALRIKNLGVLADQDYEDLPWEEMRDKRKSSTAVNGYAGFLHEQDSLSENELVELGLSETKASEAFENAETKESRVYDLTAAAILAEEELSGPEVYSNVFYGDYSSLPESCLNQ
jgi:hypothetical protein